MAKIELDKYYTPKEISKHCIEKTFEILKGEEISEIIEPSAGDGSFSNQIENCIAYDIKPEGENIIEQDFLTLDLSYKKGRLFIGNPPFGTINNLATYFLEKTMKNGDYVSFILPRLYGVKDSLYVNFQPHRFSFNLIYSENLNSEYSGINVKTCLCIFKRVCKNELYYPKDNYQLDGIKINEWRDKNLEISNYDFGICSWGKNNIGKECFKVDDYAHTIWFRLKHKSLVEKVKNLMTDNEKIVSFLEKKNTSLISLTKIDARQLIYENIPELRKKDNSVDLIATDPP